jgi:hypothetical protein
MNCYGERTVENNEEQTEIDIRTFLKRKVVAVFSDDPQSQHYILKNTKEPVTIIRS